MSSELEPFNPTELLCSKCKLRPYYTRVVALLALSKGVAIDQVFDDTEIANVSDEQLDPLVDTAQERVEFDEREIAEWNRLMGEISVSAIKIKAAEQMIFHINTAEQATEKECELYARICRNGNSICSLIPTKTLRPQDILFGDI